MFNLNDRVVYPGHGVARVNQIIKKIVAGKTSTFYELKFISKEMTILVPINDIGQTKMRHLSSNEKINDLFEFLTLPAKKVHSFEGTAGNWKQRNKEYQLKLRTGELKDISEIYRELKHIEKHKELSFCEKNLLQQTEALLAEEIALVKKFGEDKAVQHLRSIFNDIVFNQNRVSHKTI